MDNDDLSTRASGSIASEVRESARTAGQAVGDQAMAFVSDLGEQVSKRSTTRNCGVSSPFGLSPARLIRQPSSSNSNHRKWHAMSAMQPSVCGASENDRRTRFRELLRNVTEAAKSKPAAFFAGAVLAGFALSRFLKSSNQGETLSGDIGDGSELADYDEDAGGIAYGNP